MLLNKDWSTRESDNLVRDSNFHCGARSVAVVTELRSTSLSRGQQLYQKRIKYENKIWGKKGTISKLPLGSAVWVDAQVCRRERIEVAHVTIRCFRPP